MTPTQIVLLAAVAGAAAIVAGIAGLAGPWWALIAGGSFLIAGSAALLYDPDKRTAGKPR
ncbi:hypothetical protein [Mycolicibacterium vaccae]|uniref:hypothetical protein n=1 Tax=Mycolicibacterium vaccae TaxID=1810 RepID=UPI003D091F8F